MENTAPDYNDHKESLDAARMRDSERQQSPRARDSQHSAANAAKKMADAATPMGAFSLLKQIDFLGDIPYFAAAGAAMLKDLLDLVFIGSLPGIGTVITILCSIFIFMMMLLVGSGGRKKAASGIAKRVGILFGGTLIEFVPGIGFFPVETFTVGIIYFMTLAERKNA